MHKTHQIVVGLPGLEVAYGCAADVVDLDAHDALHLVPVPLLQSLARPYPKHRRQTDYLLYVCLRESISLGIETRMFC
jgi:hypothetical protein